MEIGWKIVSWNTELLIVQMENVGYPWLSTPPKINIEPENDGLEDDFPFPGVYSQVPC